MPSAKSQLRLHTNNVQLIPPSPPSTFRFLNLPGEIRNEIYALIFSHLRHVSEFIGLTKTCDGIVSETESFVERACAQLPTQILELEPVLLPIPTGLSPTLKTQGNNARQSSFDPWAEQERIACKLTWLNCGPNSSRCVNDLNELRYLKFIQIELSKAWRTFILLNKAPLEEFCFALAKALNVGSRPAIDILSIKLPRYFQKTHIDATMIALRGLYPLQRILKLESPSPGWTIRVHEHWIKDQEYSCAEVHVSEESYDYYERSSRFASTQNPFILGPFVAVGD